MSCPLSRDAYASTSSQCDDEHASPNTLSHAYYEEPSYRPYDAYALFRADGAASDAHERDGYAWRDEQKHGADCLHRTPLLLRLSLCFHACPPSLRIYDLLHRFQYEGCFRTCYGPLLVLLVVKRFFDSLMRSVM